MRLNGDCLRFWANPIRLHSDSQANMWLNRLTQTGRFGSCLLPLYLRLWSLLLLHLPSIWFSLDGSLLRTCATSLLASSDYWEFLTFLVNLNGATFRIFRRTSRSWNGMIIFIFYLSISLRCYNMNEIVLLLWRYYLEKLTESAVNYQMFCLLFWQLMRQVPIYFLI